MGTTGPTASSTVVEGRPFWNRGISALMLTDTANFRNPYCHRSTDASGTLDDERLAIVTAAPAVIAVTAATAVSWPDAGPAV
ncbi:hypothetical protein [Streptomyces sp. NPDC001315]|uniref:hypothetical protein n=1 Tax=Streptomyces sp. NPDC001315 TaxID=3364562 RepID=UPI0036AC9BFB